MEQNKTIENLEDEMRRIKDEIEKRKRGAKEGNESLEEKEKIVYEVIKTHIKENSPENLNKKYQLTKEEIKTHISNLEPEEDDRKIAELFNIAMEHGIINAVRICENLNNPHILDDFHRRLAHYFNFELEADGKNKSFSAVKINPLIIIGAAVFVAFIVFMVMLI